MSYLDSVVVPGKTQSTPSAKSSAVASPYFKSVVLPSNPAQATKVAGLQQKQNVAQEASADANNPLTIAKNTIMGIPKVVGDEVTSFGKGAAEFALSALEAPGRIVDPSLRGAKFTVNTPAFGPVKSYETQAIEAKEAGASDVAAIGSGAVNTILNDPVGVAFKPLLVGAGLLKPLVKGLTETKTVQQVVDKFATMFPQLSTKTVETIAPHIAATSNPAEIEHIINTASNIPAEKPKMPVAAGPAVPTAAPLAPSKVGANIQEKAVEQGLTDSFGGVAGYEPITIKDQAERAAKFMNTDIDEAIRAVKGETPLPGGLRGETLIKAMEDYAMGKGDSALLRDIAQSPLVSETSAHAQGLRLLAERNPESAVSAMSDIAKTREAALSEKVLGGSVPRARNAVVKQIQGEIGKVRTPKTWGEFVDSITC